MDFTRAISSDVIFSIKLYRFDVSQYFLLAANKFSNQVSEMSTLSTLSVERGSIVTRVTWTIKAVRAILGFYQEMFWFHMAETRCRGIFTLRYTHSKKNYYCDYDFNWKSFNLFINDAKLQLFCKKIFWGIKWV